MLWITFLWCFLFSNFPVRLNTILPFKIVFFFDMKVVFIKTKGDISAVINPVTFQYLLRIVGAYY